MVAGEDGVWSEGEEVVLPCDLALNGGADGEAGGRGFLVEGVVEGEDDVALAELAVLGELGIGQLEKGGGLVEPTVAAL